MFQFTRAQALAQTKKYGIGLICAAFWVTAVFSVAFPTTMTVMLLDGSTTTGQAFDQFEIAFLTNTAAKATTLILLVIDISLGFLLLRSAPVRSSIENPVLFVIMLLLTLVGVALVFFAPAFVDGVGRSNGMLLFSIWVAIIFVWRWSSYCYEVTAQTVARPPRVRHPTSEETPE